MKTDKDSTYESVKSDNPLSFNATFRALSRNETFLKDLMIQLNKILGEGAPEDIIVFLG